MDPRFREFLAGELQQIREQGLWKEEWPILGQQGPEIRVEGRERPVLNFCANNYLGLSGHPELLAAAHRTLDEWGYGMSSVRFICGTQALHLELESGWRRSWAWRTRSSTPPASTPTAACSSRCSARDDAILTDRLNHASIIDGVRLCKAKRFVYEHADMRDLEAKLGEARGARFRLIVTDGVFSMDGDVAPLREICDLADATARWCWWTTRTPRASWAGPAAARPSTAASRARGHPHHHLRQGAGRRLRRLHRRAAGRSSTCCASAAGPTSSPTRCRRWWRARRCARWSCSRRPPSCATGWRRAPRLFRERMTAAGFEIRPGVHPIVPILFSRFTPDDAPLAQRFARALLDEGIYVKGFFFPVVPRGQSRIRVQISAAHTPAHIDRAVAAFTRVGKALEVLAA